MADAAPPPELLHQLASMTFGIASLAVPHVESTWTDGDPETAVVELLHMAGMFVALARMYARDVELATGSSPQPVVDLVDQIVQEATR